MRWTWVNLPVNVSFLPCQSQAAVSYVFSVCVRVPL